MSFSRAIHGKVSAEELADRLAIRELLDAYAHCADRRDVESQVSLFTADAEILLLDREDGMPTKMARGWEALRPVFEDLRAFEVTTHFNGQNTVDLGRGMASGVLHCLAHLVKTDGSGRTLTTVCVRYLDRFAKIDGQWFFKQRRAVQDWTDTRPLLSG